MNRRTFLGAAAAVAALPAAGEWSDGELEEWRRIDEQEAVASNVACEEIMEAYRMLTMPHCYDPDGAAVVLDRAIRRLAAVSGVHEQTECGAVILTVEEGEDA